MNRRYDGSRMEMLRKRKKWIDDHHDMWGKVAAVKKAHEVVFERWTWYTPRTIATDLEERARSVHFMQPHPEAGLRHKLRITIRVEIVEEPK